MAPADGRWLLGALFVCLALGARSAPQREDDDKDDDGKAGRPRDGGRGRGRRVELENICDVQNSLSAFCVCDSLDEQDALDARCTVFNMTDQNDAIWESFSSQSRLSEVQLVVDGSDGQMHFVPVNAFRHLKALKVLEIRGAGIDALGSHTFAELKQLAELKLTRNKIRHIRSYAFQGLAGVTELDLGENAVTALERGSFAGLDALRALYLNSNNISLVEDSAFLPLAALHELDLSDNAIAVLAADTLLGLRQLRRLDMRNNRLAMIGDLTFSSVPQLRRLDLRANRLKVIRSRAFDGLLHVESVDLADNALTVVSPQAVHRIWPNLLTANASLALEGNPWRCECPLRWMSSLSSQSQSEKIRQGLKELTCVVKGDGAPIQLVRTVEGLECSPADESSAEVADAGEPATTEPAINVQPTLINDSASLHLSAHAKDTGQSQEAPSATVSTRGQSSGATLTVDLTLASFAVVLCLWRL